MMEIVKRGPKKIPAHYGMPDYWKYYNATYKKQVSRGDYNKIVTAFNKEIIEIMLHSTEEYRLHKLSLILSIRKEKRIPKIIDGKLKNIAPVDWVKTRKLWVEDEEANENKILIRYTNYHSSRYVFRVFMHKWRAKLKNKSVYKWRTSRYFQRKLGARILDPNKDKFDCYLLYKTKQ